MRAPPSLSYLHALRFGALLGLCAGFSLTLSGCARHPLPELDFDDQRGSPGNEDAGAGDEAEEPEQKPKPTPEEEAPSPGPDSGGDGDDSENPPSTIDDAGPPPEPTLDAGGEPGEFSPDPDNPRNCPAQKPAERGICTAFDSDTCNYGALSCRCIAVGWLCSSSP